MSKKTNPEVWTQVLMRVPTWANLGHRRLQVFMMLDHVSFRISSSHLAISNPSRFVHAHFLARQFSILFHNDSCLLMSFWKGPFHHQSLWLVNLFPPLPSTKGLYHSKGHDGASGWKTLHESVPRFVKEVTKVPRSKPRLSTKSWVFNDLWNPHEALRMWKQWFLKTSVSICFKGDLSVEKSVKIAIGDATHHDWILPIFIVTSKAQRHKAERTPVAANESSKLSV